jgi:glycolate oxidase FAD binding subunit
MDAVADAVRTGERLEIRSGGSKALVGAPRDVRLLDLSGLSGVVDYDPAELVLTAKPGTPLSEIAALLTAEGQMLAFDPFDHGPLFGRPTGAATLGGVLAAGVSGSRRVSAGRAPRSSRTSPATTCQSSRPAVGAACLP